MGRPRTLLVCGNCGVGKTALIRRFARGGWDGAPEKTVGLDENAGAAEFSLSDKGLSEELEALLPGDGLKLALWEIGGGHGGHLRQAPRGSLVDGLLLCYSPFDRASFQNVAHRLMQHRTDRHLDVETSSLMRSQASGTVAPPRLPVVICGTKIDELDTGEPRLVSEAEAQEFARQNGVGYALTASAKTGEFVQEVFQALAVAVLEAEENAQADAIAVAQATPAGTTWGLTPSSVGEVPSMTSPPGQRPHEPLRGDGETRLVEIIDKEGAAYAVRPLQVCLERGLLHRAVHVWLCDMRTGGLLLRKYAPGSPKLPGRWGPTCHGEVHCYGSTADPATGPHTSEMSLTTATRLLQEQLGAGRHPQDFDHWLSCTTREGNCHELVDVFAVQHLGESPPLQILSTATVEWVHYLDVFGPESGEHGNLFQIELSYRNAMVQKMCAQIAHADRERR